MGKANNLTDFLTDVADAIRAKKGTTGKINPQNFSKEIASIVTGEGGGESGGSAAGIVNFRDYDGTILYSYSKDEFLALNELPPLPTQPGLICQEWNWSIEDAKSYVAEYGILEVGATYITGDGKTRLYIEIEADGRIDVPLYFKQTSSNGVAIDWGDGSATETVSGSGNKSITHTYKNIGKYIITLNVTSGVLSLGQGSSGYCVLGSESGVYANMLKEVRLGRGVESITDYTFQSCLSLTSITIPNSVTTIGIYTFKACKGLYFVTIPNGVTIINNYSFYGCSSLNSVSMPNNITRINTNAFNSCYSLASIVIPDSVTTIYNDTFSYCYSLTSVTIPDSVTGIGGYAFDSCYTLSSVTIPESVTSIGDYIFSNCYSLTSVTVPESVTNIGAYAFDNCRSLAAVNIPNNVTTVKEYTFRNCYSLTSIVIPNSVTSIGAYAFDGCSSLNSITIPNKIKTIPSYAFNGCTKLSSVTIPESVTSIGAYAFYNCVLLTSVTIPESVTSIGAYAFYNCRSLAAVNIPNNVTTIAGYTFSFCIALPSIVIPGNVASIETYAFAGCYSLTSIGVPGSVKSIGTYAFNNCKGVGYFDFSSHLKIPQLQNTNALTGISSDCKIVVPCELYDEWVNATNWSTYSSKIVADYIPQECLRLEIEADDVVGNVTTTNIKVTAVINGTNWRGEEVEGAVINFITTSNEFPVNESTTEPITREISFTYLGVTATTTITQTPYLQPQYVVELNNQWQVSPTIVNPNSETLDGVYESFSNYNIASSGAVMYIDIIGLSNFKLYIRSNAQSNYDYVMVSQPDKDITNTTTYSDTTLVKAHTRGSQSSGTALSNYKLVEFTGLDYTDTYYHRITIVYRKDSSGNSGTDRGYVLIPKEQ